MPFVCLGLGSNIAPRKHLAEGIACLLERVSSLWVSDVVETDPVEMETTRTFLNTVVWFETTEDVAALKAWLNDVEEAMGRDRDAPDRSISDRPIDFDVLWSGDGRLPPRDLSAAQQPYWVQPYRRLRAKLAGQTLESYVSPRRIELVVGGRRIGMEPTAVHADRGAGDE